MDHETNHQTNHQFIRRLPKGERRVRFADSMGMELVSIFLFDLINQYYFVSIHNQKQLPPPKTIPNQLNSLTLTPKQQQHPPPSKPAINNNNHNFIDSYNKNNSKSQHPPSKVAINNNNHNFIDSYKNNTSNSNHPSAYTIPNSYICEFTQPISLISFKERVKLNKVHLETCSINERAGNISITCTIRVLNQSYDKSVIVRYTTDNWHTFTDSLASYKPNSNDGWSDRFTSTFSVTNQVKQFQIGQRIVFAIRYTYDGDKVFWDNNGGLNYSVKKV